MPRFRFPQVVLFLLALTCTAGAQTPAPKPEVISPTAKEPATVMAKSRLYCAGYVRLQRLPQMPEIVGAEEEQEQRMFADGDIVYINAGSRQGITEGQNFQLIRPRGNIKFTAKRRVFSALTFRKSANYRFSTSEKTPPPHKSPLPAAMWFCWVIYSLRYQIATHRCSALKQTSSVSSNRLENSPAV